MATLENDCDARTTVAPATGFDTCYFDRLYAGAADPWNIETGFYEVRKRAVLLAALPAQRYASAFEPGCGTGVLTVHLAERCDAVLAVDVAAVAVTAAARRLRHWAHVRVERVSQTSVCPGEPFDLIVLSELGYYLDAHCLSAYIASCRRALVPGGTLACCHWKHPIEGAPLQAEALHAAIGAAADLPRIARYEDGDFLVDVWSSDARSVAQREGVR